jgi:hypothetical protein
LDTPEAFKERIVSLQSLISVSVSAIWLPPSSYWRLFNFDFCAACPTNSEAKV